MISRGPLRLVRRAETDDAAAIARVHVATWRETYRGMLPEDFLASLSESHYEERWRRTIADHGSGVYVAEDKSEVVAFASGGPERAGEKGFGGELYAIYVMRHAHGLGHGRALVRAVSNGLREAGLSDMIVWVLRENSSARRFYERLGGVYVREQPITIGSAALREVSYGWRSLDSITY